MNYELKMSERRAKMKAEKSRRDDTLLTVCFSLRGINDVFDYVRGDGARTVSTTANDQRNHINQMKIKVQTMTALIGQFPASAHFQFSINLAEEAENPPSKSRHKLKFKK